MSAAHTPGPWCLGSSDRKVCDLAVCTEYPSPLEGATIARMVSKKGTEYHNAKLMAAAPDLLDAIQRIAAIASRDGNGIHHDMRMIRMLAIKTALKATGETQ